MSVRDRYDMRGFEAEHKQVDPAILSPNQGSIYKTILKEPRTTVELYALYKKVMPESSVRRILYALKYKGLAEKIYKKQSWRGIPYDA